METGSVSFKNNKQVEHMNIQKDKQMVKAIMKTKTEAFPNYEQEY